MKTPLRNINITLLAVAGALLLLQYGFLIVDPADFFTGIIFYIVTVPLTFAATFLSLLFVALSAYLSVSDLRQTGGTIPRVLLFVGAVIAILALHHIFFVFPYA